MSKLDNLLNFLKKFDRVVVAFSGGVDSSTLAALCVNNIEDVFAVTVVSQFIPKREIKKARLIAKEIGVRHKILELDILKFEDIVRNDELRCYYCKKLVLGKIKKEFSGYIVMEGTNADDVKGHRPGYKAVTELGCYSPWLKFGFGKEEIRNIAKNMGYSFYNLPSQSCLATRIPVGTRIKDSDLRLVDEAEEAILEITNVNLVRVRNLNRIAVVEVDDLTKLLDSETAAKVRDKIMDLGFRDVLISLVGYREGKNYW